MIVSKNTKIRALATLLLALCAIPAFADGEQIEGGSTWVDPVTFFKLQDINETDQKPDYDWGDIDFNNVLLKSGVKVYGLRLKPLCIAGHVEKFYSFGEWQGSQTVLNNLDYHDFFGVKGAPLSEAGFCIYADQGVSRSYSGYYNFSYTEHLHIPHCEYENVRHNRKVTVTMNITDLRMVPSAEGIAFDYTAKAKMVYNGTATSTYFDGKTYTTHETNSDEPQVSTKKPGENPLLAHFIYYKGGNRLFMIVGCDFMDVWHKYKSYYGAKGYYRYPTDAELKGFLHPWGRVYFEVEEVMIDSKDAALSQEDKEELLDFAEGIDQWLRGEGDPFHLGEHTDAKESIAIEVMSVIAAILLGGIGGFVSGSGSAIVANMTDIITRGGGGESFPPELPEREGIDAKKPEDEDEKGEHPEPPNPPDDKLFKPTQYPDLCNKYIKEGVDGTLTFKSPVSGQKTEYYPLPDGSGWVKSYGANETVYTSEELEERVRYEAENYSTLKQDHDTAIKNQKEQRDLWDKQNDRDLKRGYSDEMQKYREWKEEQERNQKHEEYIDKLADKYKTSRDKLYNKIARTKLDAITEREEWLKESYRIDEDIAAAKLVDKTCEVVVNVMGECVPGGRVIKNAYTFAKSTLVAASEAVNSNMSIGESIAHITSGAGQGALGVIQNQAGELSKGSFVKEYAITVGTEMVKDGMKVYEKTGDLGTTFYAALNSGTKKTGDFLLGKAISGGLNKLKTSAAQSLSNKTIPIDKDTGLRMSPENAKKVLTFFNPMGKTKATGLKGWDFEYKGTKADMNNLSLSELSKKFSFKSTSNAIGGGIIEKTELLSTKTTEAVGKFGLHDWEGQTTEGLAKDAVNLGNDLQKFKQFMINRAKEYGARHSK